MTREAATAARDRRGDSIGPRTAAGKARAAQNARRHGLNVPIRLDPRWRGAVEALVREAPAARAFAHLAAEGVVELRRIAQARAALVSSPDDEHLDALRRLHRYESLAYAKQDKAMRMLAAHRLVLDLRDTFRCGANATNRKSSPAKPAAVPGLPRFARNDGCSSAVGCAKRREATRAHLSPHRPKVRTPPAAALRTLHVCGANVTNRKTRAARVRGEPLPPSCASIHTAMKERDAAPPHPGALPPQMRARRRSRSLQRRGAACFEAFPDFRPEKHLSMTMLESPENSRFFSSQALCELMREGAEVYGETYLWPAALGPLDRAEPWKALLTSRLSAGFDSIASYVSDIANDVRAGYVGHGLE